jgi:hypothetical protein
MADVSFSLGLNAQELYEDLQKVTAKFVSFSQDVQGSGEKAGGGFLAGIKKGFSGIGSSLGGLGGQLTGLLGGYLGFSEFNKVVEKADEIHRTSARFGLDAEQLQVLANVGKTVGLSMDQVARAMTLITINAQKALDPMSKQGIAMQQLHISAEQFVHLNAQEQILRLADAYKDSAQDGAAFAATSDLVGRRNTAMIPLLQLGSKAILEQAKDFHTMGDAEVAELHRIKVEEDRYLTNLDSFVAKAISGWGRLFGFIAAAGSGIKVSTYGITYDKDAASKALRDFESQLYKDTIPAEQRGITPEKKAATATALEIKAENEDEKSGARERDEAERDAERDADKVRKIEREREVEALPYEKRHQELQSQADFLKRGADSAPDEAERNKIKLQYYDIVKQIEREEKDHAREMERSEKERARELKQAEKDAEKANRPKSLAELTAEAQQRDLEDRRRHGTYAGSGADHPGLVTGHVEGGSLIGNRSDADFHADFAKHVDLGPQHLNIAEKLKQSAANLGKDAHPANEPLKDAAKDLKDAAKKIEDALHI